MSDDEQNMADIATGYSGDLWDSLVKCRADLARVTEERDALEGAQDDDIAAQAHTLAEGRVARLRDVLEFYADPDTYDQVDILGRCGLSEDSEPDGPHHRKFGVRARQALAGEASDEA